MPKYFYESMTHREVKKYIRDGFVKLGLTFPEDGYWWDRSDHRPTRSDIIAMMVHTILTNPDCAGAKQYLDMLAVWQHPDREERKAAAARMGYLWSDANNGPITEYYRDPGSGLMIYDGPPGRKRMH